MSNKAQVDRRYNSVFGIERLSKLNNDNKHSEGIR